MRLAHASTRTNVVLVPHQHIGQTQGIVQRYVRITSDKYDDKGCHYGIAMVPGGEFI